ncbi:MAG: quinolinate synthase NadA [Alphaproteobacteria bacterium]|nr:quinolinate synthase NadA [Alphaproteobacteria bacterium]
MNAQLNYTQDIAKATNKLFEKLSGQYKKEQWETLAPYIYEINKLKKEKNAVILAHNYMTPDVFFGVGDVVGDSLGLAQVAAKSDADIIIQCGVHFMAETSKILCPNKKVIIPDINAGCSLASSITAEGLRAMKAKYPGIPVITYVNTSANVKAESDVCCTSSNALKIVNALGKQGHDKVIMTPDKFLAQNVAAETDVDIIYWDGACEVHERFTAEEVRNIRTSNNDVIVLAHPECPPEVMAEADFAGSTAQMDDYIKEHKPKKAVLMTECSMSDNVAAANPDIEMIKTSQMCPHMKLITLPKILKALQTENPEVIIDQEISARAKIPIERMLELS